MVNLGLYIVIWNDAKRGINIKLGDLYEQEPGYKQTSIGIVFDRDDFFIVVQTWSGELNDDSIIDYTCIPKSIVLDKFKLIVNGGEDENRTES